MNVHNHADVWVDHCVAKVFWSWMSSAPAGLMTIRPSFRGLMTLCTIALKGRELRAEACDHPTDREIIALGRRHFRLGEPAR